MKLGLPRLRFPTRCLRIGLMVTSIVLWMQGSIFLLLGVFIHNFLKKFVMDGSGLKKAGGFPIASIVLGSAMVLTGLITNFFVIRPSKLRYFGLTLMLMAIFVFEAIYFIAGFEYADTIEAVLKDGFEAAMATYREGFISDMELNLLQWLLQCCGAKGFMDWYDTAWADGRMEVPESCCISVQQCHNLEPVMVDDINQKGCNEKMAAISTFQNMFLISAITCSVITQILGIVLTITLGMKEIAKGPTPSQRPLMHSNET